MKNSGRVEKTFEENKWGNSDASGKLWKKINEKNLDASEKTFVEN